VRVVFEEGLAALAPRIERSGRRKLVHSRPWPFERRFVQWAETTLPSGQAVVLFNTHLTHHDPHGYQVERLEQALELLEVVAHQALARDLPAVVVGDLNSEPGHLALRALTGDLLGEAPLIDAWAAVGQGPGATDSPANPHNDSDEAAARIDYVLALRGTTREPVPVAAALFGAEPVDVGGRTVVPSNHYGVQVDFELRPRTPASIGAASRGAVGVLTGAAPLTAAAAPATPADRAADLVRRVRALQDRVRAIRSAERARLEDAARREAADDRPVTIDARRLRAQVLAALLAG